MTFGWVVKPSTPAPQGAEDERTGVARLLGDDLAFVAALPPQFTTLWVEDHFQWGASPTLECFTTMAYFAALFPRLRMGSIVLGQSYRNPALTAKMAATMQALTGGRFILGIGAGWKEDEYRAYGYDFPSIGTRIDQLDEAIDVIRALFSQSPARYDGRYYRIEDAYCAPRPNPPVPLLIGGSGERKTLRVVARHADLWNGAFSTAEAFAHKQAVLAEHCRTVGRDPAEIEHTYYAVIDLSEEQRGRAAFPPSMHILGGSPAAVAGELREFAALGVRHVMVGFTDFPSTTGLERFTRVVLPALV